MYSDSRVIRAFLLASGATLILPVAALGNPSGGRVTTGSAAISQSSAWKTTINQKSEDVVIDWSSFDVGTDQTTQFVQPNASALAINRIGGTSASQILGTLDANGRIVLINGNGLLFGKGARINVGSLIATSTDDTDTNVLAGTFSKAGSQTAAIVNKGVINTNGGGVVALVAPSVTNAGSVNAKFGTVALGAANKFTVDFSGDGLVSFAAQGDVNGAARAVNTGRLSGASVSMTAHAAEGLATGVVNMSGIIAAQNAHLAGGIIVLDAGDGTLTTTGALNAAGATGGGSIETSGGTAAISGSITAGAGGHWLVDPSNLTVDAAAAKTIDQALRKDSNVTLSTTATGTSGSGVVTTGDGDIDIASQIAWNTNATLTISAYHSINVLAPIKVEGAGSLSLTSNTEGTDGALYFSGGHVVFSDVVDGTTQGSLHINSNLYTLENNLGALTSGIANDQSGYFALADNYSAKGNGTYAAPPITTFSGMFEGLGNVISNVSISDSIDQNVGLFGTNNGSICDVTLSRVSVVSSGTPSGTSGAFAVGGLVGQNNGTISGSSVEGTMKGTSDFNGLLVGINGGIITDSNTSGKISVSDGTAGGLVGDNDNSNSFGHPTATITSSYSSTDITGTLYSTEGGFAGFNDETIETSYATGSVTGSTQSENGGFVGQNQGALSLDYATGAVRSTQSQGYGAAGGFVGDNADGGQITNAYSTGSVFGKGADASVGGFVGIDQSGALVVEDSYSTGAVTGASGAVVGGFVGNDLTNGDFKHSYWDITTSGIMGAHGAGNVKNDPHLTGLTTVELQAGLPSGFTSAYWGISSTINGGLPYLLQVPPS